MQDHSISGDSTTFYGIDYREDDIENGTDLGVARYMLNIDQKSHLRAIPVRSITAQLIETDPTATIYNDPWHLSPKVNRAVGSYMFTLLTGKCGLQDSTETGPLAETYHTSMRVGYNMAWTAMHLKGKSPGFRVIRADVNDTIINPVSLTTLNIRFLYQPTDTVRVLISSDNENAVNYGINELIFTPSNYAVEQTINITSLPGIVTNDRAKIYFNVESNDIFFNDFYDVWDYAVQRDLATVVVDKSDSNSPIRIYPNPSSNQITVSGTIVTNGSILSVDGRVLTLFNTNTIDVSNLVPGVYFIKTDMFISKFVKY